jgi:hypothetical protein
MLKPADRGGEPESERPIGELVHQLVEDGKAYARAELDAVRAIAEAKGKALIFPAALFGAAFVFALAAVVALAVGVVIALSALVGPLAAGLIGLVLFAAIAGGLGWYAVQRFRSDW